VGEFVVAVTEHYLKPTLELIGAAIVVLGVLLAVFRYALFLVGLKKYPDLERIQLDLVHYLMFGLTIQVGADVLSTAVSPTLADLGVFRDRTYTGDAQLLPIEGPKGRVRGDAGEAARG